MADAGLARGFMAQALDWQPWQGRAEDVASLTTLPWNTGEPEVTHDPRGLTSGERAIARVSVARSLGCRFLTARHAAQAANQLRNRRLVDVLLEEGLPSPLTGRIGAIVTAAGALTRSPPALGPRDIWRLEEERFSDFETVDLILTTAFATYAATLSLTLGQAAGSGE